MRNCLNCKNTEAIMFQGKWIGIGCSKKDYVCFELYEKPKFNNCEDYEEENEA